MDKPQTLQQAIVYFSDKDIAHQYLVDLRWSDGLVCPRLTYAELTEKQAYKQARLF